MTLSVEFTVPSPLWRSFKRARPIARETLAACLEESGVITEDRAEVGLLLSDDAAIQALNARWRGIDKPTNVLSFPTVLPDAIGSAPMLGDIAMAFETLKREADESAKPLSDHYRHLVAHGFLHLIGYDHETEDEAERMEALERRVLARFGVADPYGAVEE